ncbi:MAG: NUDIX hydrolase [Pseudomonadota bacterium]
MSEQPSTKPSFQSGVPDGDDRVRQICRTCGFVDYINPKIVAGSVVSDEVGRILMCKRAIEPRKGFWTLPAGFLEEGESVDEGARREALEEACAKIETIDLLAVYSIPRISQVQIFFRARMVAPEIAVGPESEAVDFYRFEDIPMDALAFPSVRWALEDYRARLGQKTIIPAMRRQGEDLAPY